MEIERRNIISHHFILTEEIDTYIQNKNSYANREIYKAIQSQTYL